MSASVPSCVVTSSLRTGLGDHPPQALARGRLHRRVNTPCNDDERASTLRQVAESPQLEAANQALESASN